VRMSGYTGGIVRKYPNRQKTFSTTKTRSKRAKAEVFTAINMKTLSSGTCLREVCLSLIEVSDIIVASNFIVG
jgi:hypothetical protein